MLHEENFLVDSGLPGLHEYGIHVTLFSIDKKYEDLACDLAILTMTFFAQIFCSLKLSWSFHRQISVVP
jgi:hypothetical protein